MINIRTIIKKKQKIIMVFDSLLVEGEYIQHVHATNKLVIKSQKIIDIEQEVSELNFSGSASGGKENISSVVFRRRREDAHFQCNLFRVVTTFFRAPTFQSWIRRLIFISKLEVIACVVWCDVVFII